MTIDDWNEGIEGELDDMFAAGITSFKMYLTYPAMMIGDGAVYSALKALKKRGGTGNLTPLLTAAVLCGVVLAYLVIEIQPRYRYIAMPFVFITAAAAHGRILRKTQ